MKKVRFLSFLFTLTTMLQFVLYAQVKIISITNKKSGDSTVSMSFPYIKTSNKQAADKINYYLQKEILHNDIIETKSTSIFTKSELRMDSVAGIGYDYIDYKVGVNTNQILSLIIQDEYQGATLYHNMMYYNFNIVTGKLLMISDFFTPEGLKLLKDQIILRRKTVIEEHLHEELQDYKSDGSDTTSLMDSAYLTNMFNECNITADEHKFFIIRNGILFYKEGCLGRTDQADDDYLYVKMQYKEIENFLSEKGKRLLLKNKREALRNNEFR